MMASADQGASDRPASGDQMPKGMEIEVKLRIAEAASFAALCQMLRPCFRQAHEQENLFFDGAAKELSSQHSVLRVRFYNHDRKAVITVKGKQVLEGGVGTATEEEEEVEPALARTFITTPGALLELDTPLIAKLKETHPGLAASGLVCLGGFDNLRREFLWRGRLLEVDQTSFSWGTVHELECETGEPERVRGELEALLQSHNIVYRHATKTKFGNFMDKTLE